MARRAGFGEEGVDDAAEDFLFGGVEFGDGGDAVAAVVVGDVEGPAGNVVEDEVIQRDVEGLGDAAEHVDGWGDAGVLVAAELHAWNDEYRKVIPLGEQERHQPEILALIAELDRRGDEIAEKVASALQHDAKVRYYSEGHVRYVT